MKQVPPDEGRVSCAAVALTANHATVAVFVSSRSLAESCDGHHAKSLAQPDHEAVAVPFNGASTTETVMAKNKKTSERTDWAYAIVNVGEDGLTVHYNPEDDTVEFVGAEPGSLKTERSYERASGKPKVVSSIPMSARAALDADQSILSYDRIVAVDTNTRTMHGKRCAVCISYYVPNPPKTYGGQIPFNPLALFLIVGIAEGVNPERIGWHLTITNWLAQYRPAHGPLAFIVDSELGLHKAINARKIGYYRDNKLMEGATMVYASADTDKETLQGQMIRMCDDMATKAADEIAKADFGKLTHRTSGNEDYEWFAAIEIPRS